MQEWDKVTDNKKDYNFIKFNIREVFPSFLERISKKNKRIAIDIGIIEQCLKSFWKAASI